MLEGTKVGPFTIEKELGSGAMGTVYLAKHEETGQRVAMKVVSPNMGASKTAQVRFEREAAILKQLKHPNIVRLVGIGKVRKAPFYAMEYVEGESLDHVLNRRKRLGWEEVVELGQQLCSALQHAHDNGIVHRDLKPSNLMMMPDGTIKLMDFGIAKDLDVTAITATNSTVGTAAYMSPEQCRGAKDITSKSDLYSLGAVLYELVTGHKPFHAESVMEMFVKHTKEPPERPSRRVLDIPIWLDTLICQLMEKDPEKRPFNAQAVAKALSEIKEKALSQKSAGLDAVKSRKIDRSTLMPSLDDTDKEVARSLMGKSKKKKKKDDTPIVQRPWFQAVCIASILFLIVSLIYRTFFVIASPDALFAEAEHLRIADERAAREGPIQLFLRHYPKHERAPFVQVWADEYDRKLLERQIYNRHERGLKPLSTMEGDARAAMAAEEIGNFVKARAVWTDQKKFLKLKDSQDRGWGLLAEDHLKQLDEVDSLDRELDTMLNSTKLKKLDDYEQLALDARKAARMGFEAKSKWNELKAEVEPKKDEYRERKWYLLAAKHIYEIDNPRTTKN